jgi:hypothetical protein
LKKLLLALVGLVLWSCDFEKEVTIDLPKVEKGLNAECYIERGQPVKIYLLESSGYFDPVKLPIEENLPVIFSADILFGFNGKTEVIPFNPLIDSAAIKLYNFRSSKVPEYDESATYTLSITDPIGRKLDGQTRFLPIQEFDSIEIKYRDTDSLARFLMWVQDFPGQSNYYRLIFNEDSLTGAPVLEFTFSDQNQDGKRFPIGTSNRFKPGKTMFIRLFHIEQQYYNYLRSIEAANRANGNPFAQPATVDSPMKGNGFGVFTSLNYKTYEVKY